MTPTGNQARASKSHPQEGQRPGTGRDRRRRRRREGEGDDAQEPDKECQKRDGKPERVEYRKPRRESVDTEKARWATRERSTRSRGVTKEL